MGFLKRTFITGFLVLVPLVVSIYVVIAVFNFADNFLGAILKKIGFYFPGLGILISIVIIFLVGIIGIVFKGKVFRILEEIVSKIPLMRQIYSPTKQIVNFLISKEKPTFKKVVLLEYPRKGIWSVGFVTNETSNIINKNVNKKLINVFLPSTPSPLTGVFLLIPEDELVYLDISVEEALKMIVSGGVLNPEDLR